MLLLAALLLLPQPRPTADEVLATVERSVVPQSNYFPAPVGHEQGATMLEAGAIERVAAAIDKGLSKTTAGREASFTDAIFAVAEAIESLARAVKVVDEGGDR